MTSGEWRKGKGRVPFAIRYSLLASSLLASLCLGGHAEAKGGARPAAAAAEASSPVNATSRDALTEAARWIGAGNVTGTIGPWCADFVSFVLRRAGKPPLANRMAASALAYGPHEAEPRRGDLAVMRTRRGPYGHVGFVEGVEADGAIDLLSGNWGHRVALGRVPQSMIVVFVEVR
jgi:uncharacterized protein (TIGR02594 family)